MFNDHNNSKRKQFNRYLILLESTTHVDTRCYPSPPHPIFAGTSLRKCVESWLHACFDWCFDWYYHFTLLASYLCQVASFRCNRMGEILTDQTGIRCQALWISNQVLYQLNYLVPVFKPLWLSYSSSLNDHFLLKWSLP